MAELTLARLKELLHYEPETGVFTWVKARSRCRVGGVAGTVYANGYRYLWVDNKRYMAHRLAWFFIHGKWPSSEIDHYDRNRSNNCINNLRDISASQNHFRIIGKTKRRGVSGGGRKWRAKIGVHGKDIHLGYFSTEQAAQTAYIAAAEKYFGVFASEIEVH